MKKIISQVSVLGFLFLVGTTIVAVAQDSQLVKPTYTSRHYSVKHATGFVPQKKSAEFFAKTRKMSFVGAVNPVPGKYSLVRKAGPVEDQGQCGSCWDFSLTTALRGTLITHGKDPGRLSFNYLLNCDKRQQGCDGGDFSAADLFISPVGAPAYGSDGSYSAANGKCIAQPAVASTISYVMLGDDGGQYANAPVTSYQDIAYVVGVLHQPVSIDLAVDDAFQNYESGVYNTCSDNVEKDINHMVVIEGYDCGKSIDNSGNCVFDAKGNLPNGVGTWTIRNSWGEDWGESGYITISATDSKGNKCDAVATDALFYDVGN